MSLQSPVLGCQPLQLSLTEEVELSRQRGRQPGTHTNRTQEQDEADESEAAKDHLYTLSTKGGASGERTAQRDLRTAQVSRGNHGGELSPSPKASNPLPPLSSAPL